MFEGEIMRKKILDCWGENFVRKKICQKRKFVRKKFVTKKILSEKVYGPVHDKFVLDFQCSFLFVSDLSMLIITKLSI